MRKRSNFAIWLNREQVVMLKLTFCEKIRKEFVKND